MKSFRAVLRHCILWVGVLFFVFFGTIKVIAQNTPEFCDSKVIELINSAGVKVTDARQCYKLEPVGTTNLATGSSEEVSQFSNQKLRNGMEFTIRNLNNETRLVNNNSGEAIESYICGAAQGNKFGIDCRNNAGKFQFANGRCQSEPSEQDLTNKSCGTSTTMRRYNARSGNFDGADIPPLPIMFEQVLTNQECSSDSDCSGGDTCSGYVAGTCSSGTYNAQLGACATQITCSGSQAWTASNNSSCTCSAGSTMQYNGREYYCSTGLSPVEMLGTCTAAQCRDNSECGSGELCNGYSRTCGSGTYNNQFGTCIVNASCRFNFLS